MFKPLCILALSGGLFPSASGQVVFSLPTALPSPGVQVFDHWEWDGQSVDVATSGNNVVWDFTGDLSSGNDDRAINVSTPAGTPGAGDFPNATHAMGKTIGSSTAWHYYRLDANDSLWLEGVRGQTGALFTCSSPYLHMYFPFAIGDTAWADTDCDVYGTPVSMQEGLKPVAAGTIIYPGGTINDVVMVQTYHNGAAAEYWWYPADNVFNPVGVYDAPFTLQVWAPSFTGVDDRESPGKLVVHPTPAFDAVTIEPLGGQGAIPYEVLDATGRMVHGGSFIHSKGRARLDISGWLTGNYILRIWDSTSVRCARISVAN